VWFPRLNLGETPLAPRNGLLPIVKDPEASRLASLTKGKRFLARLDYLTVLDESLDFRMERVHKKPFAPLGTARIRIQDVVRLGSPAMVAPLDPRLLPKGESVVDQWYPLLLVCEAEKGLLEDAHVKAPLIIPVADRRMFDLAFVDEKRIAPLPNR
jgi:hypothetical protein